jgi:hypothetical protein
MIGGSIRVDTKPHVVERRPQSQAKYSTDFGFPHPFFFAWSLGFLLPSSSFFLVMMVGIFSQTQEPFKLFDFELVGKMLLILEFLIQVAASLVCGFDHASS